MDSYVGDTCHVDCATTHTILHDNKYFSNLILVQYKVNTIPSPINLIKDSERATIILPSGTQFQITDALYSDASNRNLLSFKDILQN